jgi:soluble lytic murein transglycosylase
MKPRSRTSSPEQKRSIALIIILVILILATCLIDSYRDDIARIKYPKQYSTYVEHYAKAYDLPPHLVYAVIRTESDFDSNAQSAAGAIGLMQLMPSTFRWITDDVLRERLDDGMIYDPETNVRYGCFYLRRLYDRYGEWSAALAAYNAGPGRVDAWLDDPAMLDEAGRLDPTAIPTEETRRYVPAVLDAMRQYDQLYAQQNK